MTDPQPRTIVLLGAKRSGTTALHQVFVKHPEVRICHPDQNQANWEPGFWNHAAEALSVGDDNAVAGFVSRMAMILPDAEVPSPLSREGVFGLWDAVVDRYGPVVFDKTPNYLGMDECLDLLLEYRDRGSDVRFVAIVRDPRDAIASQYTLWKEGSPEWTPVLRAENWVGSYTRLEALRKRIGEDQCPLVRYENLAADPGAWLPGIMEHCGLETLPFTWDHIRPTSIGRYFESGDAALREWSFSPELIDTAARFGYDLTDRPARSTLWRTGVSRRTRPLVKAMRRRGAAMVHGMARALIGLAADRLSKQGYLVLAEEMIDRKAAKLQPGDREHFLSCIEAAARARRGRERD